MKKAFSELMTAARTKPEYWAGRVKFEVAAQLLKRLKAKGLTQDAFAQQLGVKPPQVSRLLGGQGNPTIDTVVKAAFALGYVPRVELVPVGVSGTQPSYDSLSDRGELTLDLHQERQANNVFTLRPVPTRLPATRMATVRYQQTTESTQKQAA